MLYIKLKDGMSKTWHVGERFPNVEPENVEMIQMDGDETIYINYRYPLPGAVDMNKPLQIQGSDACHIVEGIKAGL